MCIDHTSDRAFANMLVNEFERCPSCEVARQRVNNYPTFVATNKRDVRNVVSAHLPHAISHLKQPMMSVECCMTPQVRIHRVWCVTTITQKIVCSSIDYLATLVVNDPILGTCSNETSRNTLQICWIKYSTVHRTIDSLRDRCGRFTGQKVPYSRASLAIRTVKCYLICRNLTSMNESIHSL